MLLVRLWLMTVRKSESMEELLIGYGHERWSDRGRGRGLGRVLDSGSDFALDSDLDFDPDPDHSAWMARRHVYYSPHSQGNELVAAESCVLRIVVLQLSGGLRKAPWHFGLHEGQAHYTASATPHDIFGKGVWEFLTSRGDRAVHHSPGLDHVP